MIKEDASRIAHQAKTASDWTKPYEDVDAKLDELAERTTDVESSSNREIIFAYDSSGGQ